MPMAAFVKTRPAELCISFSIDLQRGTPNIATLRAYQDYDCDHQVDVLEVVGEYSPGGPAAVGGWRLLHSTAPAVDE